ncbi:LptF/LptG family permease [Candidatus Sumerlaeota bacterium]|nr:LptF/LptG family permease [Candidatus Sumerlaeota bacterium]
MPSILRRYAFREMVFPSLLAGSALTFIILIAAKAPWNSNDRLLFVLMKLAFREEISKAEVVKIFLLGLPTILMFIAPMALLVGIIIGVGRMTLDLEVRSMQTGGINLLTIFVPIILFGGILSGIAGYLSYSAEPNMVDQSIRRGAKLLISEFTNLEPGRVYDRLFKGRSGMHLYFDARDPQKGEMSGVTLMMERKVMQSKKERDKSKSAVSEKRAKLKELAQAGKITK